MTTRPPGRSTAPATNSTICRSWALLPRSGATPSVFASACGIVPESDPPLANAGAVVSIVAISCLPEVWDSGLEPVAAGSCGTEEEESCVAYVPAHAERGGQATEHQPHRDAAEPREPR